MATRAKSSRGGAAVKEVPKARTPKEKPVTGRTSGSKNKTKAEPKKKAKQKAQKSSDDDDDEVAEVTTKIMYVELVVSESCCQARLK